MSSNPFRSIIEATAPEENVTFRSPIIEAMEDGNESTEKIAEVRLLINRLRELVGEDVVDPIADLALEKTRSKGILSSHDSRTPQVVATSAPLHGILASQSSIRKSTSLGTGRRVSIQDASNNSRYERNCTAASKLFATDCPSPGQVESPRANDNTKTEIPTIRTISPRPSTGDEIEASLSARRLSDDSRRMSGGGSSVRVRRSDRYSIEGSRFSLSGQWVLDSMTKESMRRLSTSTPKGPITMAVLDPASAGSVSPISGGINANTSRRLSRISPRLSYDPTEDVSQGEKNFLEFIVLGVDRSILGGKKKPTMSSLQPVAVIEVLPKKENSANSNINSVDREEQNGEGTEDICIVENIYEYCFPQGALLEAIPTSDILSLEDQLRDRYSVHVLQFSDSSGRPKYACCYTVTDVMKAGDNDKLVDTLLEKALWDAAADVIKRAFRYHLYRRRYEMNFRSSVKTPARDSFGAEKSILRGAATSLGALFGAYVGGNEKNAATATDEPAASGIGGGYFTTPFRAKRADSGATGYNKNDEVLRGADEDGSIAHLLMSRLKESVTLLGTARKDATGDRGRCVTENKLKYQKTPGAGTVTGKSRGTMNILKSVAWMTPAAKSKEGSSYSPTRSVDSSTDEALIAGTRETTSVRAPGASTVERKIYGATHRIDELQHAPGFEDDFSDNESDTSENSPMPQSHPCSSPDTVDHSNHTNSTPRGCGSKPNSPETVWRDRLSTSTEGSPPPPTPSTEGAPMPSAALGVRFASSAGRTIGSSNSNSNNDTIVSSPDGGIQRLEDCTDSTDGTPVIATHTFEGAHAAASIPIHSNNCGSLQAQEKGGKLAEKRSSLSTSTSTSLLTGAKREEGRSYHIVSERCFCIISDKPIHSYIFKCLEAIAGQERCFDVSPKPSALDTDAIDEMELISSAASILMRSNSSGDKYDHSPQRKPGDTNTVLSCDLKFLGNRSKRRQFVSYVQGLNISGVCPITIGIDATRIGSTETEKKGKTEKEKEKKREKQDGKVPRLKRSVEDESMHTTPLVVSDGKYGIQFLILDPLPTVEEWALGTLIGVLPATVVVKILLLLLQEKSLVVCGTMCGEGLVSAIATAALVLLRPFEWAGIFVPVLPLSASEVLQAPVPFVVGTTVLPREDEVSPSAAVLYLDDFFLDGRQNQDSFQTGCFDDFQGNGNAYDGASNYSSTLRSSLSLSIRSKNNVDITIEEEAATAAAAMDLPMRKASSASVATMSSMESYCTTESHSLIRARRALNLRMDSIASSTWAGSVSLGSPRLAKGEEGRGNTADSPRPTSTATSAAAAAAAVNYITVFGQRLKPGQRKFLRLPEADDGVGASDGYPYGDGGGAGGRSADPADSAYLSVVREIAYHGRSLRKIVLSLSSTSPPSWSVDQFGATYGGSSNCHNELTMHTASNLMHELIFKMNKEARMHVRKALQVLEQHNRLLCGDIESDPEGWQRYGAVNKSTKEFEFYPERFMDPLRARLCFQEGVVHTQMFVSYMHQRRDDYEAMATQRRLLADWISFRTHLRKKRLQHKL